MNHKELPEYIKLHIIEFLDYKCIVCKKKIPILSEFITIKNFYFFSKECCKLFYIFPF